MNWPKNFKTYFSNQMQKYNCLYTFRAPHFNALSGMEITPGLLNEMKLDIEEKSFLGQKQV